MHTSQVDPSVSSCTLPSICRHMRLVDRILTENGQETGRVRAWNAVTSSPTTGFGAPMIPIHPLANSEGRSQAARYGQ